jgi:diguanylate cyclase (GGDEF)-like protein
MTLRLKWDIDEKRNAVISGCAESDRNIILELLDDNRITTHFQPIFSTKDGSVYGYEALTRIKEDKVINISELFMKAIITNTISSLDVKCRESAIRIASSLDISKSDAYLFINICPESLTDPAHCVGITDTCAEEWAIPKDRIIFEITEMSAVRNYNLFAQTISRYRERGYKIAIDDFGSGYGGLKMLSIIEPDFVKIDRHFISNIDKAMIKLNLVDSISTACHKLGIKVIAEGIETEEELKVVLNMGIGFLQGYYLARPSPDLSGRKALMPALSDKNACFTRAPGDHCFIGDISIFREPANPSMPAPDILNMLIERPELRTLPVVQEHRILGVINRNRFLERHMLGRHGFGFHINTYKKAVNIMEQQFIAVEYNTPLEVVAQRVRSRKAELVNDDICVTKNGKFSGIASISSLLDAMTDKSIALAKGANPLSGLPGNEFIQREINKRLSQNMHFDVCYIDIDHFKPYNDCYGFEKGDCVIKTTAEIIQDALAAYYDSFNFAGHIGGDDFLVIVHPQISIALCRKIIADFEEMLPEFHGVGDYKAGNYISKNRKGETETFNLLSLSIGIVSTEIQKIDSYAHLASVATEIKKAAKIQAGSSIARDRRLMG